MTESVAGTAAHAPASRNLGIPLFVDTAGDLVAKPGALLDSWYVNCLFQHGDKILGFEWHQGILGGLSMTEFVLVQTGPDKWRPHTCSESVSEAVCASATECRVTSGFGTFSGDRSRFSLELATGNHAVSVVLIPQPEELYNGTTGVLPLMGADSYEFGFPNMTVHGSMTIDGEVFAIDGARAWFDRQWGATDGAAALPTEAFAGMFAQNAWAWIGLTFGEGDREAISFWNNHLPNGDAQTFLTLLRADGVQMNVPAEVVYDSVWTSADTGNRYPARAHVTAPAIDVDLRLEALMEGTEFTYAKGAGNSGCQVPCMVRGRIGSTEIDKPVFFEMIGSVG
jgi:Lipocalin-like domain/CrtC N-terminal lipocalin domain